MDEELGRNASYWIQYFFNRFDELDFVVINVASFVMKKLEDTATSNHIYKEIKQLLEYINSNRSF